jgi:hypothetical protein
LTIVARKQLRTAIIIHAFATFLPISLFGLALPHVIFCFVIIKYTVDLTCPPRENQELMLQSWLFFIFCIDIVLYVKTGKLIGNLFLSRQILGN